MTMKIPTTKEELDAIIESEVHEALTIQALHMHGEVFAMAGMTQETFDNTYLDGIGDYERELAKREGIRL